MGAIVSLLKIGAKIFFFAILIGVVSFFVSKLMSLLPSVSLTGCLGYFADQLGIVTGFRLTLSIVAYGFAVKFGLSYFSRYLD